MLKILEKVAENTTIVQKIIFSIWLIFFVPYLFEVISTPYESERGEAFKILIGVSLIAFILFKLWARKTTGERI